MFPLLALVDESEKESKVIAVRFIARSAEILDLAYDSDHSHYLAPQIEETWEALSKDILKVRSIDPSQFRSNTFKKPDAAELLSQLQPSLPQAGTENSNPLDSLPTLEEGPIGPARFFEKNGGFDEFELRWLYAEWLLAAGAETGKKRSEEITSDTLSQLAYRWFGFALELLQSISPQAELELWQEIESGLDLLQQVRFFDGPPETHEPKPLQMAFAGLTSLPGTRGFSKRSNWGASQFERPLGVALIVKTANPQGIPPEVIVTLERVTEFIAQTLPAQLRPQSFQSAKKPA
jgi:hypothetical protein